jgi:hypothetical protein
MHSCRSLSATLLSMHTMGECVNAYLPRRTLYGTVDTVALHVLVYYTH